MWPSTRATWSEAATSVDRVIFRELATTLKPRSTKTFTIPAPIPWEAPVTMAVFRGLLMFLPRKRCCHLKKLDRSEIRVQYDAIAGLAGFKPGEGLVDFAHREVLGLRRDVVP